MNTQAIAIHEKKALGYAKRGLGFAVTSGMLWGLDAVLLGLAFYCIPFNVAEPAALVTAACLANAAMHDGIAGLYVLIYNAFNGKFKEYLRTLKTKPGRIVCLGAFLGGPVGMSCYLVGLNMAGTYAVCVSAMYPTIGAIAAGIILKEKIPARVWGGILLCVVGMLYMSYTPPEGALPENFYLGIGLAGISAFCWGMEGVLATYGMDLVDSDIAIGLREGASFTIHFLIVLPLFGGTAVFFNVFSSPDVTKLMGLMIAAGMCGGMSYQLWYKAFISTGVSRAMALNITYALWAIVFSVILSALGIMEYELTKELAVSALMITAGAILVVANPKELLDLRGNH